MMGMLIGCPQNAHNNSGMNTAAEFKWEIRPVNQVVTNPTSVAIASEESATNGASGKDWNCMRAVRPLAKADTPHGLHFSAQRIGAENERSDNACDHDEGAGNAEP